jgi:phosphate-selective porin OprO/OprP
MRRSGGLILLLSAFAAWTSAQAPTKEPESGLLTRDQVQQMIDKALADKAEKKQADGDWAEVANNPRLEASWDNSLFFTSPNKDWRVHLGGRMQFNSVWWDQPEAMRSLAPGGGIPAADRLSRGVGPLDDGTYFRRLRFRADGTGYETVEFMMEVNFEQVNYLNFDHVWVGMKDLPLLGTVRVGQHKVPMGLDMVGSDYYLTFLERAVLSEAFLTLFAPGVYIGNTYLDDHVTTHAMFHKLQPLQFYDGTQFGDGNYAFTGRATWTPLYEHDGACVVHVGGAYQFRTGNLGRTIAPGTTGNGFLDTQKVVRFRARPELRDAVGIVTPVLGGTSGRFVDTGFFLADHVQTIDPEFMVTWGPLNFRAEAALAYVDNARTPGNNRLVSRGNPFFWGAYAQVSYFLTGEHWGYDRRQGVYDRPRVLENAFVVQGEDGRIHHGIGAWEVAYRYSFVDLNDAGISGGQMDQHTFGLNWYLNDNTRLMLNYLNIQRNAQSPAVSGTVHGLGLQAQWYF